MNRLITCAGLILAACSEPKVESAPSGPIDPEATAAALLQLGDSIFAAARARDADRFASYFSARADFVYLINTRLLLSRDSVRAAFAGMLSRQQRFDPRWGMRRVQILSSEAGIVTGLFDTEARLYSGEEWEAHGVITFIATREASGWRVVNWHTTE